MLTRLLFLTTLLLAGVGVLGGAWPGSSSPPHHDAETSFVPKIIPLDSDMVASGSSAEQILQKAIQKLDPERVPWLKTKIRQTIHQTSSCAISEGFLQLGPQACARLELNISRVSHVVRLTIVSDGVVVAQERTTGDGKPVIAVEHFAAGPLETRRQHLARLGCGGPETLLRQMQASSTRLQMQTGVLDDVQVIQIKGDANAEAAERFCLAYLDAKTLWPIRMEWWSGNGKAARPIRQIEFLAPEIGRELTHDECMRAFSYRPAAPE